MNSEFDLKLFKKTIQLRYKNQPELLEVKLKLLLRQLDYEKIVNQDEREENNNFLTKMEKERWDRQIRQKLIFQNKLKEAKVAVFGCGGVGTNVLKGLIYSGVYNFKIVDFDTISTSNLNRQTLYTPKDIGKVKTEIAKNRLLEINPDANIVSYNLEIDYPLNLNVFEQDENDYSDIIKNIDSIIKWADIIVSAMDFQGAPYLINDLCVKNKKPFYWGNINQFVGEIYNYNPEENTPCIGCIYGATSILDKTQLHRYKKYGEQTPVGINIGTTVITIGNMMAEMIIHSLSGIKIPFLGHLLIIDNLKFEIIYVPIKKQESCKCYVK